MEKAQFIHIESYSKKGAGKAASKYKTEVKQSNVTGVLGEAKRLKSYCSHVSAPVPPKLLYGCSLDEVKNLTEEYYNNTTTTTKTGQKKALRTDSNILLAGVVSVPNDLQKCWNEYKQDTVLWLKNKYGNKLKSVIEHTDEPNPHLHFYVVQDPGQAFDLIHDGKKTIYEDNQKAKLQNKKPDKKSQISLYKKAMKLMQDDFYNAVSAKYSLKRVSENSRSRVVGTTEEYKKVVEQTQNLKSEIAKKIEEAKSKGFRVGLNKFNEQSILSKIVTKVKQDNKKILELESKNKELSTKKNTYKSKYKKYKFETIKLTSKVEEQDNAIKDFYKPAYSKKIELEKENKELEKNNKKLVERVDELNNELIVKNNILESLKRFLGNKYNDFMNYFNKQNTSKNNSEQFKKLKL